MIRIEKPAAIAVAPNPSVATDPKEIIATAMLELSFQGRTVTAEAIAEYADVTSEEIETYGQAAADLARLRRRQQQSRAA